jgi:TIR domain
MNRAKVFLSYVRKTKTFVDAFAEEFFPYGDFERVDWLIENVPAGDGVSSEITQRIYSAGIFIAFICKDYPGRMGADELRQAVQRRKDGQELKIVPLTLGLTGRDWWKDFKKSNGLDDIADDIFFTPGTDVWDLPNAKEIQAIQDLAVHLDAKDQGVRLTRLKNLVILGHPKTAFPQSVRQGTDTVIAEVAKSGITATTWADGWCDPDKGATIQSSALFLQPLSAKDAPTHVQEPGRTERNLLYALHDADKPAIEKSRFMLWLPKGEEDAAFAKQATVNSEANPAFRTDDPTGMAGLLARIFGKDKRGPVLAFEGIDEPERARKLSRRIHDCVNRYLPTDDEQIYVQYPPKKFEHYFRRIADQRPILVAHDLDASPPVLLGNSDPYREIVAKFRNVQSIADKVLDEMGREIDDVFWVACISNASGVLHDMPHLPHIDVERWIILELERKEGELIPNERSRGDLDEALGTWARRA